MTESVKSLCACDCGRETASTWHDGCDGKMYSDIIAELGGVENLKQIVEDHLGRPIPRRKRLPPV